MEGRHRRSSPEAAGGGLLMGRFDYLAAVTAPDDEQREPSTWAAIDLTAAVDGGDVPAPTLLTRTDGTPLLYRGRVHWLQGEPESLKSWLANLGVAQVLEAGGACMWIDFEDDEGGLTARLLALGVPKATLLDQQRFRYLRPDEPLYDRHGVAGPGAVDFDEALRAIAWDLVVVDGVTEAMTLEGLALIDNADVARWMRLIPKRIASVSGAAVAVIDHLTKSRETRLWQRGRKAPGRRGVSRKCFPYMAVSGLVRRRG